MIKMKGYLFRVYKNDEGKKVEMYKHANGTARYIVEGENIPSKTNMPDFLDRKLVKLGYHIESETTTPPKTERQIRKEKAAAKHARKIYLINHPEEAERMKKQSAEVRAIRAAANVMYENDKEWNKEFDVIREKLPKDKDKRQRWIDKYNESNKGYWNFSVKTETTSFGKEIEVFVLKYDK